MINTEPISNNKDHLVGQLTTVLLLLRGCYQCASQCASPPANVARQRAVLYNCLQYAAGPATTRHDHCNVSGRRDHRCLSLPLFFFSCPVSVLANLSDFEAILLPRALSLSPPNVLFVGNWSEIYRSADLPGVADERLIGSNWS